MVKPFEIKIPEKIIQDIYNKVKQYPWDDMPNIDMWKHGTNLAYMKEISNYWVKNFNWKKHEEEINKFSNFTSKVDDIDIHFIQEKGSGSNPTPLLLMHGWPGSIIEFFQIIEKLAHPEKFGGKEEDAFDIIIPSLPGFGFSGGLSYPMGPRKIAEMLNKLMIKNIGYKNYFAQGGDWGATICNWLAYDHSQTCKAIHINCLTMRHPDGPKSQEEKDWQIKFDNNQIMQDG
ncbi:epoxide hydrolase [Pelagibacteraceae bacterium]|nr:epoxide hydrolase [Pelagibacteraceae bacterium]